MKTTDLTDRWGEPHNHLALTDADRAACERLLPLMWDELTFIHKRGDEYGVLVEGEYDDGYVPSAAEIAAWADAAPAGAVFETFQGNAERPTFNDRWVAWGWFPESMATAAAVEAAGRRWLGIAYRDAESAARAAGWLPALSYPEHYDAGETRWVRPCKPEKGEYTPTGLFEAIDAADACECDGLLIAA